MSRTNTSRKILTRINVSKSSRSSALYVAEHHSGNSLVPPDRHNSWHCIARISRRDWQMVSLPNFAFIPGWVLHGRHFHRKNRPATFKYPLWSFMGDYKMIARMLMGRESFNARQHPYPRNSPRRGSLIDSVTQSASAERNKFFAIGDSATPPARSR